MSTRKPARRSGVVRYVQVPTNLNKAIAEAARAAHRDFSGQVLWMCREWLEGRTSESPVKIRPDKIVKRGPKPGSHRKPKPATPETASSSSPGDAGIQGDRGQGTTGDA